MDTLQSLRLFSEVGITGSFSAAARTAGLSTASVSRHVLALENSLGVQLVKRTTRQCSLTEAGISLFEELQTVFKGLQDATERVKSLQTLPRGVLRVHARVALGTMCIGPALPAFLKQHPDIQVRLSLSNDNDLDLIKHAIDVDLRTGLLPDSSLISRKLSSTRRLLVASPEYVARHGTPQTPADLAAHNCLLFRVGNEPVVWRFRDQCGVQSEFLPRGNLESDSGSPLRAATFQGIGISQMTDWSVAADIRSGQLVRLLPDYLVTINDFNHGVFALYTPSRHSSPKVRVFIDFLIDLFKSTAFRLSDDEFAQGMRA
jgi:DNA-binding transcriptional LysR family regulator